MVKLCKYAIKTTWARPTGAQSAPVVVVVFIAYSWNVGIHQKLVYTKKYYVLSVPFLGIGVYMLVP